MKTKRMLTVALTLIMLLSGCGRGKAESTADSGAFLVYYKNLSSSGINSYSYDPVSTAQGDLIKELWEKLSQSDSEEDRVSVVGAGVEFERYVIDSNNIEMYFNSAYEDMDTVEELLFRTAVVKTFTQLEGIESVTFFSDEKPVTNSSYAPLGAQKAADYVDIIGSGLSNVRKTTLTLYYTDSEGSSLVKTTQDVVYESSYSIEKDVVNRLISGPSQSNCYRTLPENLQLISISVKNKVCYVNFDSSFETDALSIDGDIIVYSIVNSLTELSDVQKVQIMVNGEKNIVFRDIDLSSPLERNLNY